MDEQYTPPTLTIDSVIFRLHNDLLEVLLINRNDEPFKGHWALPGGYNADGFTTQEAMADIVARKTGLDTAQLDYIEQLYTFDTVADDPRGHAVSVTYMGLGKNLDLSDNGEVESPKFYKVTQLPKLAFDHSQIIEYAHQRLQAKITYTNAVFALLPQLFTMTQLQNAYEAILLEELDKRNFRKKFLSLDMVEETDETYSEGAHRPARLYRFKKKNLQTLTRNLG